MRGPVGLDLNGWHDFASRDWEAEDQDDQPGRVISLNGGIRSVVVSQADLVVGGPQALLSPIGRGQGWGEVGHPLNRRWLTDHWAALLAGKADDRFRRDMLAAAAALSQNADQIVVCMPDRREMNEQAQRSLLDALTKSGSPKPFLLWRSVALVLGLLDAGQLPAAAEGTVIACLTQVADGIEHQTLVLRRDKGLAGQLAPERAGAGTVACPQLGLRGLLDMAVASVRSANPGLVDIQAEVPLMPGRILFDEGPLPPDEIIRRDNGNWLKLNLPDIFCLPAPAPAPLPRILADYILLLSPLASRHMNAFHDSVAGQINGAAIMSVAPDTAARGALFAARRIERGIPHYFDRLDQVSLLVMRGPEPTFLDLVPPGAVAPGNREYVSETFTGLEWPAGLSAPPLLIRKGEHEIRKLVVTGRLAPARSERLELRLRQTPAQGWARLLLSAVSWDALRDAPIELDWSALEIETRSEAEIIEQHRRPRPTVPERFEMPSEIGLWDGSLVQPGLSYLLEKYCPTDPITLKKLALAVRTPSRGPFGDRFATPRYAISSNGTLPDGLNQRIRERFQNVVQDVSAQCLKTMVRGAPPLGSNDALLFLTWVFSACPSEIQNELIQALKCENKKIIHPFLVPGMAWKVVRYGVGRAVGFTEAFSPLLIDLLNLLPAISAILALSIILSRSTAAPKVLADHSEFLDEFAKNIAKTFDAITHSGKFTVTYTELLKIVTGLLRVRECRPWALMTEHSAGALNLSMSIQSAVAEMKTTSSGGGRHHKKIQLSEKVIQLLETDGGVPNLLALIEAEESLTDVFL